MSEPTFIRPTIGRALLFYPHGRKQYQATDRSIQPNSARVTYVHSDRLVNIGYIDGNGIPGNMTSVVLVQPGDTIPDDRFCCWMPYTIQQEEKKRLEPGLAPAA